MSNMFQPNAGSGAVSPLSTKGDVWGYSTQDARIPVGPNGSFPRADSGSNVGVTYGPVNLSFLTVSASTAITFGYNYIKTTNSGVTMTHTLPTAVGHTGTFFDFEKVDNNFTPIFVQSISSQPLNVFGATILSINTQGEKLRIVSDGATGYFAERYIPNGIQTYGISISAVTTPPTLGTTRTITSLYWREGRFINLSLTYEHLNAGAAGSGPYLFPHPQGIVMDTSLYSIMTTLPSGIAPGGGGDVLGHGVVASTTAGDTQYYSTLAMKAYSSTMACGAQIQGGGPPQTVAGFNSATAINFGVTTLYVAYKIRFPVVGWQE